MFTSAHVASRYERLGCPYSLGLPLTVGTTVALEVHGTRKCLLLDPQRLRLRGVKHAVSIYLKSHHSPPANRSSRRSLTPCLLGQGVAVSGGRCLFYLQVHGHVCASCSGGALKARRGEHIIERMRCLRFCEREKRDDCS